MNTNEPGVPTRMQQFPDTTSTAPKDDGGLSLRFMALEHAVTTHGATHDQDQVLAAARDYLAFLQGEEKAKQEPAAKDGEPSN